MSTIEQTASGTIDKIPTGRRIAELLQERGDAFSIRAFAERIGINRETFRNILKGERAITLPELEKVVEGLHIAEDRLRQLDTKKKEEELASILNATQRNKVMLLRAYDIAKELVAVALGATERGYALNNLGRVQYLQKQYDEAHETWLRCLDFAKQLQEQYDDNQLLHFVTANLMLTYAIRKEYSNIEDVLSTVERALHNNPQALGMAYFTRMKVLRERGNLEYAKKCAYCSLEHFEQTKDQKQIGIALINVAYCEYLVKNFSASAELLISAIQMLRESENYLVIAVKDYVKTLIKLRDYEAAVRIVEQYEPITREHPDYWGKLQIMYTILKDDPSYADRISENVRMSSNVRFHACRCLFEFFALKDDDETAMKYYKKGRIFSTSKADFFDEEGF